MNYNELLYAGRYDELVNQALPHVETDKEAACAFLRLFLSRECIFLLDEAKSIDLLTDEAEKGNRYAQYAYARWQTIVRGGENSVSIAYQYMQEAAEQNLPDAIAGLAISYEFGDIGTVDWKKEDALLQQAFDMGSELAAVYRLQDYCFGRHFQLAQPHLTVELADRLIARNKAEGIDPCGYWFYYRATANESRLGRTYVTDDYRRALDLGVLKAYTDLLIAYGYGDSDTVLVETPDFTSLLREGMDRLCPGAFYMDAAREMHRYDALRHLYSCDEGIQRSQLRYQLLSESHDRIHSRLSQAARLGDTAAWEQLGDCYYDGSCGFEQSYEKAFTCYSNGAIHDAVGSIGKLWRMMHDHLIDRPLDYVDSIALQGARCGSKRLLAETVIIHQEGRLVEYTDEIERFYDPIFDAPEFTLDNDEDWQEVIDEQLGDDEPEEDDGRYDAWA